MITPSPQPRTLRHRNDVRHTQLPQHSFRAQGHKQHKRSELLTYRKRVQVTRSIPSLIPLSQLTDTWILLRTLHAPWRQPRGACPIPTSRSGPFAGRMLLKNIITAGLTQRSKRSAAATATELSEANALLRGEPRRRRRSH